MESNTLKGALVAVAAAGLFACASGGSGADAGPSSKPSSRPSAQVAPAAVQLVKCSGINECKGHGACGGQGHDCAGKNECKGQGWVETSAEACAAEGGHII